MKAITISGARSISRDEREREGRALRKAVPRSAHATIELGPHPRDPVALIVRQDQGRYAPLLPIRYGRMLKSPFAFLRGAAAVMAADLARTPSTGIRVQACGDCHLLNFGAFRVPQRGLVFDINDFDETLRASWEWDVKRLAASVWVAGRSSQRSEAQCLAATMESTRAYRERLALCAAAPLHELWLTTLDATPFVALYAKSTKQTLADVATRIVHSGSYLLPKLTEESHGSRRIRDDPPLIYHPRRRERWLPRLQTALERYRNSLAEERRALVDRYRLIDVAVKVVGVGSVGTFCAIALLEGPAGEFLFLQIKQARPSVLASHVERSGTIDDDGKRIVVGQRLAQSSSDPFLGWSSFGEPVLHFYVRELRDVKLSIRLDALDSASFERYAQYCGWALAQSHAKTGDAAMISTYLGRNDKFDDAVARFARIYADRTESDYAALDKAERSGRIVADRTV